MSNLSKYVLLVLPYVGVVAGIPLLVWRFPAARHLLRSVERAWSALARRRWLAIAVSAAAPVAVCATLAFLVAFPQPTVHDEFSYLLAADTFARGRAANPTHPQWEHFESMHIIHQPTYASKYPPGQGLFLAVGRLLTGLPIAGAWLSLAAACGAICWMLMAWLPPRWALVGGLLAGLHPLVIDWGLSYWGGGVAMLGGALLVGGYGHVRHEPRARHAIAMAAGLGMLAMSRPFEGFVLACLVGGALALWIVRAGARQARSIVLRIAPPVAAVMIVFVVGMGFYNRAVTGSALTMPYQVHERTYGTAPVLIPLTPNEPTPFRHAVMRDFYTSWAMQDYVRQQSVDGFLELTKEKMRKCLVGYLPGPTHIVLVLLTPLLALWVRRTRFFLIALALFLVPVLFETWLWPHYVAPVFCLVVALQVFALRTLYVLCSRRWRTVGKAVVHALLVLLVVTVYEVAALYAFAPYSTRLQLERPRTLMALLGEPGDDLVIVRYGPTHNIHEEWVYNGADIDGEPVVWARDMGDEANRDLIEHFRGRRVWLFEPDLPQPKCVPYEERPSQVGGVG